MYFNVPFYEPEKSPTGNNITRTSICYYYEGGWRVSRFENVKERKYIHHTQNNVIIIVAFIIIIITISDLRCAARRKWHSAGNVEVSCRRRTVHDR